MLASFWADHPNAGGIEFIALSVGLNFALVGWKTFIRNIGESEANLYAEIRSHIASIQDKHKGYLLSSSILCVERTRGFRRLLWSSNYVFACVAFLIGVYLLYCGESIWWSFILMIPPVAQIALFVFPTKFLSGWIGFVKWRCSFDNGLIPNTSEMEEKVRLLAQSVAEGRSGEELDFNNKRELGGKPVVNPKQVPSHAQGPLETPLPPKAFKTEIEAWETTAKVFSEARPMEAQTIRSIHFFSLKDDLFTVLLPFSLEKKIYFLKSPRNLELLETTLSQNLGRTVRIVFILG